MLLCFPKQSNNSVGSSCYLVLQLPCLLCEDRVTKKDIDLIGQVKGMYLIHSVKNSVRYTPKSFKQELALFTLGSIDMWAFVYLTHQ